MGRQVEHHARSRVELTADAHALDEIVLERQHGVPKCVDGPGVFEIKENARRAVEPLVVERHLALELQRDAQRIGKRLTPYGGERDRC